MNGFAGEQCGYAKFCCTPHPSITPKATLANGEVVTIHHRYANGIGYITPTGIRFAANGYYTE